VSPRVTVAIPTWNRAELLRGCIESVRSQTFDDFELIVIDNASTDHTPDVVASFDDPRVQYVRNPENIGGQPNLNRALRAGCGEYVVVLFDDDYLLPSCLERKAALLDQHPDVVVAHSSFEVRRADGTLDSERENYAALQGSVIETSTEFIELSMLKPCRIHISSAMCRRTAIADEAFRPEDLPADDHGFWLRVAAKGGVGFIDEALDGLHMVAGVATGNGLLALDDGRLKLTLQAAESAKRVMRAFLDSYDASPREIRRLRRLASKGSRVTTVRVLRSWVPGFRPRAAAMRMLVRAVRIEPGILIEPRLAKLFVSRGTAPSGPLPQSEGWSRPSGPRTGM
jgi:glycosyltransferase involved in cell wall biosynthesis